MKKLIKMLSIAIISTLFLLACLGNANNNENTSNSVLEEQAEQPFLWISDDLH